MIELADAVGSGKSYFPSQLDLSHFHTELFLATILPNNRLRPQLGVGTPSRKSWIGHWSKRSV